MSEPEIRALAAEVLAGRGRPRHRGDVEDLRLALDLDSMDFLNFVIALAQNPERRIPEAERRSCSR